MQVQTQRTAGCVLIQQHCMHTASAADVRATQTTCTAAKGHLQHTLLMHGQAPCSVSAISYQPHLLRLSSATFPNTTAAKHKPSLVSTTFFFSKHPQTVATAFPRTTHSYAFLA
jgi:hypothetical protein